MGSIIGMGIAIFGSIAVAIFSYFKHRSSAALIDRASGSGKAPCKWLVKWDHETAINWAKDLLDNRDNIAIIDITESGHKPRDEIIEIAIMNGHGKLLLNSLVKPESHRINPTASMIHGLKDADLSSAPGFSELIESLRSATTDRTCIYFDLEFVFRIVKQTFQRYEIDPMKENFVDLRHYMAAYEGDWSPYDGRYHLPTLPGSDYRAPGNCKIMLDQIERMAADIPLMDQGDN